MLDLDQSYYLLLLDLKGSTALPEKMRQRVFRTLEEEVARLTRALRPQPALGLEISYGDEVAGLFERPTQLYKTVRELRERLFPHVTFRFVVCCGRIGIVSDDIRRVGGPIFKQADELIKRLKTRDGFCAWSTGQALDDAVLTSIITLSNLMLERMTEYQRRVYQLLSEGRSRKSVAEALDKYPQSISRAIKQSGADEVVQADRVVDDLLKDL